MKKTGNKEKNENIYLYKRTWPENNDNHKRYKIRVNQVCFSDWTLYSAHLALQNLK